MVAYQPFWQFYETNNALNILSVNTWSLHFTRSNCPTNVVESLDVLHNLCSVFVVV